MNELQVFNNAMFGNVRIILQNEEPWFVAKDVTNILVIKIAVRRLLTMLILMTNSITKRYRV